jgi:uncharacterized membrane protein YphA (DoxX/SURF4 family)
MPSAHAVAAPAWAGAAGLGRGPAGLGRLFLGLGLVGFGVENALFGSYVVARATPWPSDPTAAFLFACVTGALLVAAGLSVLTGRWMRELGLQAAFLILAYSLARHWPKTIAGDPFSGDWTNALKAIVFAVGPLLAALESPEPVNRLLAGLRAIAPHACAPFFLLAGIQHILFVGFVVTLVPPFIPGARFWTYFAAAALLAAGFGLLMPPVRRLAAMLTGWMVFSWVWLVHLTLVATRGREEWKGVVEALAISGVCFLIAASAGRGTTDQDRR